MTNKELFIEHRIIMTPGPVEADPRVLRAMINPIIGQFDPEFLSLMDQTMEMGREIFQTKNKWTYAIVGTARSGMEALLFSIVKPNEKVFVPIIGRFGHLIAEIAQRAQGNVHTSEKPLGEVFTFEELKKEIDAFAPKVVAIVHGESSTGMMQPLEKLGKYCRKKNIILVVDNVATLAGAPFYTDKWCIDAVASGSQKCLAMPAGLSLITYNERVEKIIMQRQKIEQGLDQTSQNEDMILTNYLDLSQLQEYWGEKRLNHHTEATSMLYALYEAYRLTLKEGLSERIARHALNKKALIAGLEAMGLTIFGDLNHQMPTISCVNIPKGIDEAQIREELVTHFNIEIAPGFGPLKGKVWRVGALGYSSRKQNILIFLGALETLLLYHQADIHPSKAVLAALEVYNQAT